MGCRVSRLEFVHSPIVRQVTSKSNPDAYCSRETDVQYWSQFPAFEPLRVSKLVYIPFTLMVRLLSNSRSTCKRKICFIQMSSLIVVIKENCLYVVMVN
jgi:hypothetical protein